MGGRGSTSSAPPIRTAFTAAMGGASPQPQQPQPQPNIANQAPSPSNVPIVPNGLGVLASMSDDQLAQLYQASKTVDMPNHLSDVSDATQRFVFTAGLNEKPQVLTQAQFQQYMQNNGIPRSQILSRTTGGANYTVNGTVINLSPAQCSQLLKDGQLTYIGGKWGGQALGAGNYFDMNGGANTGYGGGRRGVVTSLAVLSNKARVIDSSTLQRQTARWVQTHPKFARAVGGFSTRTASIYALAQGYSVIRSGSYHNVIDRTALVMQDTDI